MAYCNKALAGISLDCGKSKGGIKKIFIANKDPKPMIQFPPLISVLRDIPELIPKFTKHCIWYEYNFKKNTASMTSTLNVDVANSVNYIQTELTVQFNKMDIVKRTEIVELAKGELHIVVVDCNNKYWYLGFNESVDTTAGTGQSGQNKTDGNFFQLTFTDMSQYYPLPLGKEAIESVEKSELEYVKLEFTVKTKDGGEPQTNVDYFPKDLVLSYKAYDADLDEISNFKINSTNATVIADKLEKASDTDEGTGTKVWELFTDDNKVALQYDTDFVIPYTDTFVSNKNYPLETSITGSQVGDVTRTITIEVY